MRSVNLNKPPRMKALLTGSENVSFVLPNWGPNRTPSPSDQSPPRPSRKPADCWVCLSLAPFKLKQAEQQAWRSEDMKWPLGTKNLDVHRVKDSASNCKAANRRASNWEGALEQGTEITLTPFSTEGSPRPCNEQPPPTKTAGLPGRVQVLATGRVHITVTGEHNIRKTLHLPVYPQKD